MIMKTNRFTFYVHFLAFTQQEKGVWEFAYEPIKNMIGNLQDPTLCLLKAKKSFKEALSRKFVEESIFLNFNLINFRYCICIAQ
jgi:hypothetical protein